MNGSVFESQRQHVPVAILADDSRDSAGALRDWIEVDNSLDCLRPRGNRGSSSRRSSLMWRWPPRARAVRPELSRILGFCCWRRLGWLFDSDSTRFVGIPVWLQPLLANGWLVVMASCAPAIFARVLAEKSAAVLPTASALPRRLRASGDHRVLEMAALGRITRGGEAADGPHLHDAKAVFPT